MKFRVGPWIYRVRVMDVPIVENGVELLGQAVMQYREIRVSPVVAADHRFNVVLHELKHAWLFHFPQPRTDEEQCNLSAAIMASMYEDLNNQGGVVALENMTPDLPPGADERRRLVPVEMDLFGESQRFAPPQCVQPWETLATSSGDRAQCRDCGLIVAGGSIVSGDAKWDDNAAGVVIVRTLYCPHCDHLQEWTEGANLKGKPNGSVVGEPRFVGGEKRDAFLAAHPECAGMVVT